MDKVNSPQLQEDNENILYSRLDYKGGGPRGSPGDPPGQGDGDPGTPDSSNRL